MGNSNDKTKSIIKNYLKQKPKIKVKFISEKDEGIYDAINKGINLASGKYVSILNSDDIFHSNKSVKKIISFINKNKDTEIFFWINLF